MIHVRDLEWFGIISLFWALCVYIRMKVRKDWTKRGESTMEWFVAAGMGIFISLSILYLDGSIK
jgi:hypothetical protein